MTRYNYGWNPNRTSLTEDEWIAIHTRGSDHDQFPDDEPEDALDAGLEFPQP